MLKRKVEASIVIACEAEKIIAAFTAFEMLKDWWSVERSFVEKSRGGTYMLLWGITAKGIAYISSGTIEEYDPNTILKVRNFAYVCPDRPVLGNMTLTIRIEKHDGKSKVHLCQSGYQNGTHWDWYYNVVSKVWPEMLTVLKQYLENKPPNQ
ncbi:MAG: SRPBCC family protein [Bacteroidota bacterium]